jgi:DNA replication and repair protein RecF
MFSTLRLQNYRIHRDSQYEFNPSAVTIVVGPNGSGKTSIVEALYMACSGGSYKAADLDVVANGADWARIDIGTPQDDSRSIKLQVKETGLQKIYVFDGVEKQRFLQAYELPVVLFEPQDMSIIVGEPSQRRELLDRILSTTNPNYRVYIKNYRRALAQRNALLKLGHAKQASDVFVWDVRLSELGGVIHQARKQLLEEFDKTFQSTYVDISKKNDIVTLRYVSDETSADYTTSLLAKLQQNIQKDSERGFTSFGPHRDDLEVTINGSSAKTTASRGETRTLMLAIKLLELQVIKSAKNTKPLLLLDDVFSELDGAHRRALAEKTNDYQTIITTTEADAVIDHFSNKYDVIAL